MRYFKKKQNKHHLKKTYQNKGLHYWQKKIQAEYFPDFFNSQEASATNFPVEKESYR